MTTQEMLSWLCLAVAVLGFLGGVSAIFDHVTSDWAYILYGAMLIGGFIGFVVLR